MALDLQIDQPHLVPRPPQLGGDQLDPQRLQPQEDLRVHQRAGMDGENFHRRIMIGQGIGVTSGKPL